MKESANIAQLKEKLNDVLTAVHSNIKNKGTLTKEDLEYAQSVIKKTQKEIHKLEDELNKIREDVYDEPTQTTADQKKKEIGRLIQRSEGITKKTGNIQGVRNGQNSMDDPVIEGYKDVFLFKQFLTSKIKSTFVSLLKTDPEETRTYRRPHRNEQGMNDLNKSLGNDSQAKLKKKYETESGEKKRILVLCDTSGSISREDLCLGLSTIKAVLSGTSLKNIPAVDIGFFTTALYGVFLNFESLKGGDDSDFIAMVHAVETGGTNTPRAIEQMNNLYKKESKTKFTDYTSMKVDSNRFSASMYNKEFVVFHSTKQTIDFAIDGAVVNEDTKIDIVIITDEDGATCGTADAINRYMPNARVVILFTPFHNEEYSKTALANVRQHFGKATNKVIVEEIEKMAN